MINKSKNLYNSIIKDVSKIIKKHLNEAFDFNDINATNKQKAFINHNVLTSDILYLPEILINELKKLNKEICQYYNFGIDLLIGYYDNTGEFINHGKIYIDDMELYDVKNHSLNNMTTYITNRYIKEISELFKKYYDKEIKYSSICLLLDINTAHINKEKFANTLFNKFFNQEKYKKYNDFGGFFYYKPIAETPLANYNALVGFLKDLLSYCEQHKKDFSKINVTYF